jgi:MFS family permease
MAQTVSVLGDFLAVFAVQVAVVFRMHGSARDMAGVFVAASVPSIILGPVAGVFADRWDPRRTMIVSDFGRGLLILSLMRATSLTQIYAISFAVSCVSSFFTPAQAIAIPLLVPRTGLLAANARMQQSMQVARMVSPALASALVAAFGERICYGADSASFFLSAAMLATLRCTRPVRSARVPHVLHELRVGARFLFTDSEFTFAALALTAGIFAAGCFSTLAPVYVRDVLQRGPSLLGMIGSLIAAGTVAGAAGLSSAASSGWVHGCDPRRLIGGGMAGVGASILLIAAVPAEFAALAGSAGMGLSVAVVMVAANVMLQGEAPPELRGRTSGALASLTSLAQLAAMLLAGAAASRWGIRGVFLLSAALLFATGMGAFLGGRKARVRSVRAEQIRSRPRWSKCAGGSQSDLSGS